MTANPFKVPEKLIYEMVDGVPIYYRGYREYLNGEMQLEQIMGSSYLQSFIVSRLLVFLVSQMGDRYEVLGSELGLQIEKNSWRAADLAILDKNKIPEIDDPQKYLSIAPEAVIEIDTKAELRELPTPVDYYFKKTDQLLGFGVKKVLWIFTESKKIMLATSVGPWKTFNWDDKIALFEGIDLHLASLVE